MAGADGLLAAALARFLSSSEVAGVYEDPAAFEAFIRAGGNVALYDAVSAALAELYVDRRPAALLDIGCGDGRALLPALRAAGAHRPGRLDLVEPSAALLASAVDRLAEELPEIAVRTWPTTVQEMIDGTSGEWPMAQSTFALHTLPHERRTEVLAALRQRVGLLAIVEFDVPDVTVGGPEHIRYLAGTYERGLAEYHADRDLVAQGFLMPVLVGQLWPGAPRVTWEQSARRWGEQLLRAGYAEVTPRGRWEYWSAPAFLLTARGR